MHTGKLEELLVSAIIVTYNRKDEVIECVESVLRSTYKKIEVIVVDNASLDNTADVLEEKFSGKVQLIRSEKNIYAGGGRNLGAANAKGEYLLFIDSDNVIAPDMIEQLLEGIRQNPQLKPGIIGPFTYYKTDKKRLCWVNSSISLLTSITRFGGMRELDNGQYDKTKYIKVGHIPNVFMLEKEVFNTVGGIDKDYVMHYEESDLAEKVLRLRLDVVLFPHARTWHDLPQDSPKGHKSFLGRNPGMVYYVSRNRILFMRKNSKGIRLFLFLVIFSNIFLLYNILILIRNGQFGLIKLALKGYIDGLKI